MSKITGEKAKLQSSEFFLRTIMEEQAYEENYLRKIGGKILISNYPPVTYQAKEKVATRRAIEKWKEARELNLEPADF
jgi:hypothetical protein